MKLNAPLFALLALPAAGAANIQYASQTWYVSYIQNSLAAPTTPYSTATVATMGLSSDDDIPTATWSGPLGALPDFIVTPTLAITYSSDYGSDFAGFVADYPVGDYVFSATSGPSNGLAATLSVQTLDFPAQIPHFTGSSYNNLQLCPPGVPQTITWNSWASPAIDHTKGTTISVIGYTVPGDNSFHYGDNNFTSTTIPGSALSSGRRYFLQVDFYSSKSMGNIGFGNTVPVSWSFNTRTYFPFSVDASPGTVAGQLTLGAFNRPFGEIIDWEVIDSAGTVLDSGNFSLGYDNWYAFDTTAIGNYRVRFKARHWLSKVTAPQPIASGVNFLNVTLTNGDVNGDNIVDIADYARLAGAFDAMPSSPNWDEPADLDGSSLVDIADYAYLAAAFDGVGE